VNTNAESHFKEGIHIFKSCNNKSKIRVLAGDEDPSPEIDSFESYLSKPP
jgi:hypothetical protein